MVDPKEAARRLMIRNAREQAELDARRALAQEEGRRLAQRILTEITGARTVRGFGSTWELWRTYRKNSDIDLAMDGGDMLAGPVDRKGSMKTQSAVLLLTSELDADYTYISEATALVDRARQRLELSGIDDELDLMVLGACLHGLYNAIEAYFLRIAKFCEMVGADVKAVAIGMEMAA